MKIRRKTENLTAGAQPAVFLFFLTLAVAALIFTGGAFCWAEEGQGPDAGKGGDLREALARQVEALQAVPESGEEDLAAREMIFLIAQKLDPPPAVPEEARRHSVRGKTAVEGAKSTSDFSEAAAEFAAALKIAPWWADGYYNLAVAQEGAGQLDLAMRSLKLYLLAASGAADAKEVQDRIYSLEYRAEKERQEQTKKDDVRASLPGADWRVKEISSEGGESYFTATASIRLVDDQFSVEWNWDNGSGASFTGRLSGSELTGSGQIFTCCPREAHAATFKGTVAGDGRSIAIQVSWYGRVCSDYKLTRE